MVRRKRSPRGCRGPRTGMTVKLKSGEERKPDTRVPETEEEEEATAAAAAVVVATEEVEDKPKAEGNLLISEPPNKEPSEAATPEQPSKVQQDQHHFLRSCVRPHSKRQRKDSGSNGWAPSAKSKALDSATPSSPSCSTGLAPSTAKASGRNVTSSTAEKDEGNKKKVRRQWESWSTEDKNTFFEALYEHGKDFEAIQNNIALKYKKKAKPASMVKNKEQVRHFYYRTWHKISKYIDFNNIFSCGLKKSSQELYGLICYGELRKKIGGCMDDKNAAKLNELIQLGATTVRYKGRNLRIKAPMCRALKKLCDPEGKTGLSDEEDQKPVRLPLKVPVELQPRNNQAWARVQSLAQNPRLRMMVELHRKVSSLIEFLKQKWALQEVRIRKSLDDHQLADVESQDSNSKEELYLFPPETAQLSPLPGVTRVVHSKAHCTVHWQETGKCKQSSKDTHLLPPAQILGIQTGQGTARVQLKCPRGSADAKQGNKVEVPSNTTPEKTLNVENGLMEVVSSDGVANEPKTPDEAPTETMDTSAGCEVSSCPPPDVEELSLNDPLPRYLKSCQDLIVPETNQTADTVAACSPTSPESNSKPPPGDVESTSQEKVETQTATPQQDNCTTQTSGLDTQVKEQSGSSKAPKDNSNQLTEQLRQEGWNQQTSENLTLAEVYLMLGKPGKLQLEYEWMDPNRSDDSDSPLRHKQKLLSCLLRLISTELSPKTPSQTPEMASVATSPLKLPVQEQTLTPPSKVITLVSRNPECLRTQPAHLQSTFSPTSNTSGFRNLSRPLLFGSPLGSVTTSSDGAVFAVPTMLPPNSRHAKISSPNKESEAAGRQHLDAISSDFFLPKSKKQRSRHLRKPLVVQRTLLPRLSGSSLPHVCSFSILSNSSVAGRGSFRPIHSTLSKAVSQPIVPKGLTAPSTNSLASAIDLAAKSAGIIPGSSLPVLETDGLVGIDSLPSDSLTGTVSEHTIETPNSDPMPAVTMCPEVPFIALSTPSVQDAAQPFQPSSILSMPPISQNALPTDPTSCTPGSSSTCFSPPNVSALLDISLPGPPDDVLSHEEPATHISDSIIEIAISSGQYGEAVPLSPAKLNENSKSLPSPSSSPHQNWIASPSHDPQWYPNDSSDSSLSSLLSSFISPEKNKKMATAAVGNSSGTSLLGPSLLDGSSRDSFVSRSLSDVVEVVDSQLACLMNENSIDYISRFNDLAQELSATDTARREPTFEAGGPGNGQPIRDLS
ncbi:protein cramped-like isoform X2 [Eleutherodactylus coqui]|uniref:protein cramped-like isoform X2 n=1 Tax=Eleutherodactylus coqui TaxID=57060 RepID=UPI0034622428